MVQTSSSLYLNLLPAPTVSNSYSQRGATNEHYGKRLPIQDYDEMTSRIRDLRATEVEEVREYEKRHKNRYTLLERLGYSLV